MAGSRVVLVAKLLKMHVVHVFITVTKIGTPFRKSTEAVLLNTFHYINGWQYPWSDSEVGTFQGNDGIPFLKVEGNFFVAEEQEFTSVAVPLEVN